ncbi:MAG TPA: hypothetical protein DD379_15060 [Cyanobacteria bacterium UBA11162]|nr:hypothetical protein [Cyanobacteria bacterium UBA12227]HAX87115.1 hypothetical protein [Cyanobacteria bacterium UBA11370]HBL12687.1 hypothetical protein [Cyanobacteria bacterium UBA11162]HBY80315.1 hypothetical protein [Cyanobacteria bacterium UBA11148]
MKLKLNNWSTRLLYLLLATDFIFISLHILYKATDFISDPLFSLEQDLGYAEVFQYIKEYWIALCLGLLAATNRSLVYLSWSLLFLYLLVDDSLQIHETWGESLSQHLSLSPMFNLRMQDFGELIVSSSIGLFFLILIGTSYKFSDRLSRKSSKYLIGMLLSLALFGIAIDLVHVAFRSFPMSSLLGLLEDGGEHGVMSVIAWFVFLLPEALQSKNSVFPSMSWKDHSHEDLKSGIKRIPESQKQS